MFRGGLICPIMCFCGNTFVVSISVLFVLVVLRIVVSVFKVMVDQLTLKFVIGVKFTSSTGHINRLLFNGIIHLSLNHLRNSFEVIFLHGLHFSNFNSRMLTIAVKIILRYKFFYLGWILSTSFL